MAYLNPWEQVYWGPEQEQLMYRDWGLFFMQTQQVELAARNYDRALAIRPDDYKALLFRSRCKRLTAQTAEALKDCMAAEAICSNNAPINLEICNSLYELNQFETCIIDLYKQLLRYKGNKIDAFVQCIEVIVGNYNDNIGDSLGQFFIKNEKHIDAITADINRRFNSDDERPLWKILKDRGKCDVMSILEKEEVLLSPREIARRFLATKVFNQIYLNSSWIDMLFIKLLHTNADLLLQQTKTSTPILHEIVVSNYKILKKFLKMLNARSPLYNEQLNKCPDKKREKRVRENNLYRIQYQTHRNMHTILRNIKQLRSVGEIEKLSKYIENVMGDYVVLKTYRVMPWKIEFMYEVYNTLALAHTDRFTIPHFIPRSKTRMLVLLRMPTEKKDNVVQFKFGDRSTYQEPDGVDNAQIAYKRFLARLEKRMRFAKFSIEKCYLLHETARNYLEKSHFDECCSIARQACEEAKKCNSLIWHFLSLMLICKSHTVLNKIERSKEVLEEALPVAEKLKSVELCNFVELCIRFNNDDIMAKNRNLSSEMIRKRRSKMSVISARSMAMSNSHSSLDDDDSNI